MRIDQDPGSVTGRTALTDGGDDVHSLNDLAEYDLQEVMRRSVAQERKEYTYVLAIQPAGDNRSDELQEVALSHISRLPLVILLTN